MSPAKQLSHLSAKERALIKAIQSKDTKSVRALIAKGVNVNCEGGWEYHTCVTPLMFASEAGNFQIVSDLLKAGADPNRRDMSPDVNRQDRPDATALHYAVHLFAEGKPSLKVIKALLDAGADPNDRYAIGDTALDIASRCGFEDAVELLLEHGGDPNATVGMQGRDALSEAVSNGHLGIVRTLLKAGAHPNGLSDVGATPIMGAVACPRAGENGFSAKVYLDIMRLLLKAGAEVDRATIKGGDRFNPKGRTALMMGVDEAACSLIKGAFRSRLAAIQLLIEEGRARVNLKDSQGKTALDYASVSDFPELPEYLKKHGARLGKDI